MKRVSDDGKVLTVTATLYPENGAERIVRETKLTRVADGPPGSHAISGTWKRDLADDPASTSTIQIHSTADGISLKSPSLKYTAKLDGKDYPATGDENVSTVSLEPVDGRTLKETDKLQGMVMDVLTMSVSADGRTMTIDDDDKSRNQKATYVMDKQ